MSAGDWTTCADCKVTEADPYRILDVACAAHSVRIERVSREWRAGLTECAVVGFDYGCGSWTVETGRTVDGLGLADGTGEVSYSAPIYFPGQHEARDWMVSQGYR